MVVEILVSLATIISTEKMSCEIFSIKNRSS
jgi:hypothetical protein